MPSPGKTAIWNSVDTSRLRPAVLAHMPVGHGRPGVHGAKLASSLHRPIRPFPGRRRRAFLGDDLRRLVDVRLVLLIQGAVDLRRLRRSGRILMMIGSPGGRPGGLGKGSGKVRIRALLGQAAELCDVVTACIGSFSRHGCGGGKLRSWGGPRHLADGLRSPLSSMAASPAGGRGPVPRSAILRSHSGAKMLRAEAGIPYPK